jgi:hypothetical protein
MAKEKKSKEGPIKQPALPLMIGDYFKDPLLGQASLLSRGAWTELLMFMWECDRRGEIKTTPVRLTRLIKADSIEETMFFLNELYDIQFGDLIFNDLDDDPEIPLTTALCNEIVTIRNRRMYADFKDRQNTRLRVRKYRKKMMVTPEKQECNDDVTPSLSVSVSITDDLSKDKSESDLSDYPEKAPPKKSKHVSVQYPKYIQKLKTLDEQIKSLPQKNGKPFNTWMWIQQRANENGHHLAVIESLEGLIKLWPDVENPMGFATHIYKTKNPNFNERDYIVEHEKKKLTLSEIVNMPEFKQISKSLFRGG